MDAQVRDAVTDKLADVLGEVETGRKVLIGPAVRSFISDIVFESLEVREDEWMKRGLDPSKSQNSSTIASTIEVAVRSAAGEAETRMPGTGPPQVLLVGVIEQTHKKWCGVFPFCR